MDIAFSNIEKTFGQLNVIQKFNCVVKTGEFVALVGPSGCGKSTLLHLAAGLELPNSGELRADDALITGPNPERMLMFQENALYPWLTLQQNVGLALEFQGVGKARVKQQALAWLDKVKLAGFHHYYPHQVSGGMRQRAALARAFIAHPNALLLDEPFGALDALTRLTLQDVLRQLIQEIKPTVLLVTHDVDEALFLADRVLVFSARPAVVLKEFRLDSGARSHDLADFTETRREILHLLGIQAQPQLSSSSTQESYA